MSKRHLVGLLAVLVLGLALAACGGERAPQSEAAPTPPSAPAVANEMAAAMSSLRTIGGDLTTRQTELTTEQTTGFMCDAAGSYCLRRHRGLEEAREGAHIYNARRHALLLTSCGPQGQLESYEWDDAWPYEEPMTGPLYMTVFRLGEVWRVRAALT